MTLPDGWALAALNDLAEIQGGIQKQPKRTPARNAFPFLRVANVMPTGLDLEEMHEIELFNGELATYRLEPGDLLVVEGNGSASQIGRAAVWDGSIPNAVHQNHLIRVRPGPRMLPRYLGLVWNSPRVRDELTAVSSSTSGLHTLSVGKLGRIQLPTPPLDEQRRIVEILEDHLSRLDAADRALESAIARTGVLEESAISSAPELVDAPLRSLDELLSGPLSNGRSVPTADHGFPVLRLTAMRNGHVDLNERKTGRWEAATAAPFLVARDDVFVARGSGSLRLVGRAARVIDEPGPVAFPDTMIRARLNPGRMRSDYLTLVWNSRVVRRQIERAARTTAGIYKVNQKDLLGIKLPWIPVDAQTTLVARVERMLDAAGPLSSSTSIAQRRSASLRRSLLAAAFSGRLTSPAATQVPDQNANAHFTAVEEVI